jgi:hypothetical protein
MSQGKFYYDNVDIREQDVISNYSTKPIV